MIKLRKKLKPLINEIRRLSEQLNILDKLQNKERILFFKRQQKKRDELITLLRLAEGEKLLIEDIIFDDDILRNI